ncbi:MAG: hypothetical protein KGM44_04555 [bacterium]|nr:hypothetical protein [bacterium]
MLINRVCLAIAYSSLALFAAASLASAEPLRSLEAVAHAYGYEYVRLNPELAVELTRPGVDVVIKPGTRLFWVNGTPDSADVPPAYRNRDIYVSAAVARKLAAVARASARGGTVRRSDPSLDPSPAGGQLTLGVIGGVGAEALDVFGSAPPNAPVRLSLSAQISRDLPTIPLSSTTAEVGPNGKFSIQVPIAPNFSRGSVITVRAATAAGEVASATYVVDSPNPRFSSATADSTQDP